VKVEMYFDEICVSGDEKKECCVLYIFVIQSFFEIMKHVQGHDTHLCVKKHFGFQVS
jgi:hypothetical protein